MSRPEAASSTTVRATSPAISAWRRRTLPTPATARPAIEERRSTFRVANAGNMPNRMLVTRETTSGEGQHAAIERDARDGEKVFGQQQQEAAQGEKAHTDAHRSTHQRQQQVFNPELLLDLPARGSQRQPGGNFRSAAQHANQRQPGQIGAGDEQDEARGQHQRQHLRTRAQAVSPFWSGTEW